MKKTILITALVLASTGVIGAVYYRQRSKKWNKKFASYSGAIEREFAPLSAHQLSDDAFDIDFKDKILQEVGGAILKLTPSAIKKYSDKIHDAWGVFNDKEEQVYGVLKALKDKVQISQVAKQYWNDQDIRLDDDIRLRMSVDEQREVKKIIRDKKRYRRPDKK